MAYTKQIWHDLPQTDTPISATKLNHIEDGIESVEQEIPQVLNTNSSSTTNTYSCNYINNVIPTVPTVHNSYSVSTTEPYSANYVNNKLIDVYSASEVKTNKTWIDGKPIYRKVIVQALAITSDGDYYISHGISNFKFCTSFTMHGFKTNESMTYIFPYTTASKGLTFPIQVRTSDVVIRSAGDTWSNTTFVIILEYTKTTD